MTGNATHYFAVGNTARGRFNLYESAFQGLNAIYMITGSPGTGKSTVLQQIAEEMQESGRDVQLFHCPLEADRLDGVILADAKIGIVDGNACGEVLSDLLGGGRTIHRFDFDQAVDPSVLASNEEQIRTLRERIEAAYTQAYETYDKALRIHDEWEAYYIGSMNFGKAEQVTQELIDTWIGDEARTKAATVRHLFLGAATPRGSVDYVPNLTANAAKRIFVKGRPGSGKSTMLKKLAAAAERQGIDVDVFHCGFDPNSLDMLVFPELSLAIFDSTAPHEHFPNREGDEILDMYERTMAPGTDEAYAEPIAEIKARYSAAVREATGFLAEAKIHSDLLKEIYVDATDYSVINRLQRELREELREQVKIEERLMGDNISKAI